MLTSYPSQNDIPNDTSSSSQNDVPNDVDSEATLSDGEDKDASDGRKLGLTDVDVDGFVENEGFNYGALVGDDLGLIDIYSFHDVDRRHDGEIEGLDEVFYDNEAKDGSKDPVVEPLSDPALVDVNACEPDNSVINTIVKG